MKPKSPDVGQGVIAVQDERGFCVRAVCGSPGWAEDAARTLLVPFGWAYGGAMALRNTLYEKGFRRVRAVEAPVFSVGNISLGGSGKTPFARWLAERLAGMGRRPALVSRGYRAGPGQENDEAAMLRQSAPGLLHVADPDRAAAAEKALREMGADCIVLDDGFQHRRLRRNVDIVLVDALDPIGGGRVFPAGRLREPLSGLGRADALVLTRCRAAGEAQARAAAEQLARLAPGVPLMRTGFRPVRLVPLHGGPPLDPGELAGRRVFAFCGLGAPAGFLALLRGLAPAHAEAILFEDHGRYGPERVARLAHRARHADMAVTTQKDAVKLAGWPEDAPAYALEIELEFIEGEEALLRLAEKALGK